jgi:hypothetical protein
MFKFFADEFFARHLRLLAAVLGTLAAATLALTAVTAHAEATNTQSQLQQLADNAALAGVATLGTSDAQTEADRREDAIKATKQSIGNIPGVDGQITASVLDLTVTVKLSVTDTPRNAASKTLEVASTARYVAPDQAANWSWASRQHFAAGQPPVVAAVVKRRPVVGF